MRYRTDEMQASIFLRNPADSESYSGLINDFWALGSIILMLEVRMSDISRETCMHHAEIGF